MSKEVPVNSAHLTTWECYDFLDRHLVGRICISDDDGPLAIPVSYRIVGPEQSSGDHPDLRRDGARSIQRPGVTGGR